MHILYMHQFFTTPAGTSGTRSHTFAREWVKLGHRVTVLTGAVDGVVPDQPRKDSMIDGIEVVQLGVDYRQELSFEERKQQFLDFALQAARVACLDLDRPDVIYASSTPLTIAIPALAARARHRCPLVFEVRDLWPDAPIAFGALSPMQIPPARALEHAAYAASEAVVALSPGMLDAVLARGADRRSLMIPNGVDRELFAGRPDRAAARAHFGLPADDFLVVYVGALGPVHGIAYTLDAVRLAAERGIEGLRFVLFGDGSMAEEVAQVAEQYPNHLIAPGPIPRGQVPIALSAADVTLTTVSDEPILRTTCSNKLFDAMAAARPQIVNLPGWNTEIVCGNGIGYAAEPASGASILDAALVARDDPEREAKSVAAGRLGKEYEREEFAVEIAELLASIVGGERGGLRGMARRGLRGLRGLSVSA